MYRRIPCNKSFEFLNEFIITTTIDKEQTVSLKRFYEFISDKGDMINAL